MEAKIIMANILYSWRDDTNIQEIEGNRIKETGHMR